MNQPLEELGELFPELGQHSNDSPRVSWRDFQYEQQAGVVLHDVELIDALFDEHKVVRDPWGDPLGLGDRRFSFLPQTQRARARSLATEAVEKYQPSIFYERWLPWIEHAFKDCYSQAKERAEAEGVERAQYLYQTLREVSLRVVARTVCVAFKGELLKQITTALEGIDTTYARVCFGGKRARFGLFTSSDIKLAQQFVKTLEGLIRPLIRERIGGSSDGDDLIARWVNTRGQDGRSLKEDQIIDLVTNFLTMAYTSLPKVVYGAVFSITQEKQPEFLQELQRELNNTVKLITNPPVLEAGTPAPATPQNAAGQKSLPLHHAVVLEALRLYPPHWLSQVALRDGLFLLGSADKEGGDGPTVDPDKQIWMSALALHSDPERFQRPARFWPQRWSGNLDSSLPRYAFAPFGFEGRPSLSEGYCVELATRVLMIWFARYAVVESPPQIQWELSLCLRPKTDLSWAQKRDLEQES